MNKKAWLSILIALLALRHPASAQTAVVVIGHAGIDKIDAVTVQKVFTGRVVELGGVALTPINASAGSATRLRFLQAFLNQDEDKYVAYWTVRRYIGKGVPPKELASASDVIRFVQSTPGAIGYVEQSDLVPGLNVLTR